MKKKLLLIALCGSLAMTFAGCSVADDIGDMVSDVGQDASEIIDDAGNAVSDAVSDMTGSVSSTTGTTATSEPIETSDQAISALVTGNQSYLSGSINGTISDDLRSSLAENGQSPHTIVITCSDSRVPPELIFNSSLGDLFVIRTAGNVVGDYEIGSVEYAAEHLGSPLVVVMGHSSCGAVSAAIEGEAEGKIQSIVEEIAPSVETARSQADSEDDITDKAENLNVVNTINELRQSDILSQLEAEGKLTIVGAKYDIGTGKVTFFDDSGDNQTTTTSSSGDDTPSSQERETDL